MLTFCTFSCVGEFAQPILLEVQKSFAEDDMLLLQRALPGCEKMLAGAAGPMSQRQGAGKFD